MEYNLNTELYENLTQLICVQNYNDLEIKDNKLRISKQTWSDFISSDSLVGYEPLSEECFVIKSHSHTEESDSDCYIYNLKLDNWTFGRNRFYTGGTSGSEKNMTNIINYGDNYSLGYLVNHASSNSAGGPPS